MSKVPKEYEVLDVSAYCRKPATWLAIQIRGTGISPHAFTVSYLLVGLFTGWLILHGEFLGASVLVLLKNYLDTVDGSLARVRQRPSKVGRFLDADFDFLVNAVYVVTVGQVLEYSPVLIAFWFLVIEMQGSVYNYYFVKYRELTHGDVTSKVVEDSQGYEWDNPHLVKLLYMIYVVFYKWQDWLIKKIDKVLNKDSWVYTQKWFLTAVSFLGLGVHLLLLAISLFVSRLHWFFYGLQVLSWYVLGLFLFLGIRSLIPRFLKKLN